MIALIKRNSLLYFRNRSGVLFSLLSAGISFVLYLVFLKHGMKTDWSQLPQTNQLLDSWLIGGTLTLTGISATLAGLNQLVKDRESQVRTDLLMTDTSAVRLQISYLISAAMVGLVMQIIMLAIMLSVFNLTDHFTITIAVWPRLVQLMVINSLLATVVNAVIIQWVGSVDNIGRLATIIGTASGFLVGIYIPIGSLPKFAQTLVKLTPGSYVAALYRQVLMTDTLKTVFHGNKSGQHHFERLMGVQLTWSKLLTQQQTYHIIGIIFVVSLLLVVIPTGWLRWHEQRHVRVNL